MLLFDNTNGLGMGVALANSDFSAMTINATFKDGNGGVIGTIQFTMEPNTHTSFVLTDRWPFTAGKQGTVSFDCSDSFGANAFGLASGSRLEVHAGRCVHLGCSVHKMDTRLISYACPSDDPCGRGK